MTDRDEHHGLLRAASVLAVCAHPDDESFGLGAVLDALTHAGSRISVLCLTHGETGQDTSGIADDLAAIRSGELASAAQALGVERTEVLDYPDGVSPRFRWRNSPGGSGRPQ